MNKVMICGNVGNVDVHVGTYGKLVRVGIATSEKWKGKDGEKHSHTEWHNVIFNNKLADIVEMYVEKGDKIIVGGKIKTSKPFKNKDGLEQTSKDIVADFLEMLGGRADKPQAINADEYARASGGTIKQVVNNHFEEDDIPF